MHIHILGICGTFMGGIAQIAKQLGHTVSGSDANVYPPMSTQLEQAGIVLTEGWDPAQLQPAPDMVIVGNAVSRGNPALEYVLEKGLRYTSGPQWLAEQALWDRWVVAVAGTHGKTTTTSMLTWILDYAGCNPGFLVGGVPENFGISARITDSMFFVIEADEYDTAFCDKRSKFVHYRPRTAILNNLEFDHADIFADLVAIETQFHHLVRTIPGNGLIVAPAGDAALTRVLERGCWTPVARFGAEGLWQARAGLPDGSAFDVYKGEECLGRVEWALLGQHNVSNALAAIAAAEHCGVRPGEAIAALAQFKNVKRRMELKGEAGGVRVYDDFAHHPTAIETTLGGLRARVGDARILAILDPRSNTMRMGVHKDTLAASLEAADWVVLHQADYAKYDLGHVAAQLVQPCQVLSSVDAIVAAVKAEARPGDLVLIMSNGGFGGIHEKLLAALSV
ncbi:MAG: UDP-N-acetylmuramate:L-alanyl-gamma-D-glutamyl-meso-diaminopimelate ligase [Gammaproteobacteria bacterium]|nr:UDP-N-acetylmuramate:L-alanyl-gamma-D-glutamyl-meso-diaminopimelate ligase [Gammaproteobacteria bacterium]